MVKILQILQGMEIPCSIHRMNSSRVARTSFFTLNLGKCLCFQAAISFDTHSELVEGEEGLHRSRRKIEKLVSSRLKSPFIIQAMLRRNRNDPFSDPNKSLKFETRRSCLYSIHSRIIHTILHCIRHLIGVSFSISNCTNLTSRGGNQES